MQLLVTGVREALEQVGTRRTVPKFRHTADPGLFVGSDRGPEPSPDR